MTNAIFDILKQLLEKIAEPKLCLAICLTMLSILLMEYYNIITYNSNFKIIFIILFFLSLFLSGFNLFSQIHEKIKINTNKNKDKKNRLIKILKKLKTKKNSKTYINLEIEKIIITSLYNNNIKSFTEFDFEKILPGANFDIIKEKIDNLTQNTEYYYKDALLFIKDGKYYFYNSVWNELKKYNKNGLLNYKDKE